METIKIRRYGPNDSITEIMEGYEYKGVPGDKTIHSNMEHMLDAIRYAVLMRSEKPLTFWERMECRWAEVKRRVTNAYRALRGECDCA